MTSLPALRQLLFELARDWVALLHHLDLYRRQMRASLYRHRVRCGHPRCHCAKGPGHVRWCLSFASPRGRHTRTLSRAELGQVSAAATAYRRYRQARARIARAAGKILRLVDRIGRQLERPVPRR